MRTKFSGILTLLLAFLVQISFAQQKTVTGTVTDASGLPLPGVNIIVKGTSQGTQTDFDGNYAIQAEASNTLVFSYVGFQTQEVAVGAKSTINVSLAQGSELDEVVVVAFGTQEKKKNVQSIAVVDNEAIKDIPANSPQELLQGQAAGVQVVQSSGVLGAAPTIRIRGTATINSGASPLFVVDGVPLNDTDLTSNQGANQGLNPLANINPNDIESISVLKDASATAVYGSRGANGVVLITTKSGKKGQDTQVTLNVSTGTSRSTDVFDMMTTEEYSQYYADAGIIPAGALPDDYFNWVDGVTRTGTSQNIDASVSGGSEKTSFYFSMNSKHEDGFIIGNGLNRTAGRININHSAKDWLDVGVSLGVTNNDYDRVGAENSTFAPLTSAYLIRPFVLPRDENGAFVNTGFIANTIAIETLDINRSRQTRTTGNIFATAKLTDDLSFTTKFGIDRVLIEEQQRSFDVNSPGGFASNFYAQDNRVLFTNTLNYDKTFNEVHDLGAVVGMSYEENEIRTASVAGTGFVSDAAINVVSAAEKTTTTSGATESRLVGYFARANYAYDDRYILEGSIRRDGSSRFGANEQFGTFYAAAAGWNIGEEAFMENVDWVNNLKIRASYGVTGNDRIGNFSPLGLFRGGTQGQYNGNAGVVNASSPNPNLRWEQASSFDIGISGGLFENRISFNLDFYKQVTDDLILFVPFSEAAFPDIDGRAGANGNIGEVENVGVDITLTTDNIRTDNFTWTTSINVGINENEVTDLGDDAPVDNQGRPFISGGASQRAIEGESVNTFYLIRYVGVNPQTGDAEWLDADGNITLNPSANDRVIAGDATPDFAGGITNTFRYKSFDLNVIANYSVGNDIFIDGLRFTDNAAQPFFNNRSAVLNTWRQPGDNAFVPSFDSETFSRYDQRSTLQLRDGSFLRIKNVTLGYTIPQKFMQRIPLVNSIRLYGTATNLVTIKGDDLDGIDPEVTDTDNALGQGETFFTPPQSKSYLFGATLTF